MGRQPTEDKQVLLVIPTYNNRSTLRKVVEDSIETGFPVLVINDGSTDSGTDTLATLPINLIDFPENRGKGVAIHVAAEWAKKNGYSYIITMDADGQHMPQDAFKLAEKIKENPLSIVIGNRDFSRTNPPGLSKFGRKFSNFWVKISSGISVADSQSGFRAYPVEALIKIKCNAKRYNYEVEILVKGIWTGLSVQSVDIAVHYSDDTSKSSHFRPFLDNALISLTYTHLVIRNFIPLPHKTLFRVSHQKHMEYYLLNPIKTMKMLITEKTSARQIGYATSLGIFLGTLPLVSVHSITIMFFANRLKLNRLVALNVSHLCAPPIVPAIAIETGYFICHGKFLTEFTLQTMGHEIVQRMGEYLIGATFLAFPLAILAGILAYLISIILSKFKKLTWQNKGG